MAEVESNSDSQERVSGEQDYTNVVVPESARRSNFRILITFMSTVAAFGTVYVGYTARFEGLSFIQLIVAMGIATATMSLYCIGSANSGAVVGQTSAVMARSIFGKVGSRLVSLLLVISGMAFYVFTVLFVMSLLGGLVSIPSVKVVTAALALIMIVNTFFGFTGVQKFAQYVAVPVVLAWGIYATIRGLATVSGVQLASREDVAQPSTVLFIAGVIIGLSTWGNEADIFRFAKTRPQWNIPTVVVSYSVGSFVFPIMGYVLAVLSDRPDFGPSIRYFVDFTLFGATTAAFVFFLVNQVAVNDANLYVAVNGVQNFVADLPRWKRRYTVMVLGLIAAGLTFILPSLQQTLNIVTGIGATTVPTASTIMAVDIFLLPRLFSLRRPLHRVATWKETATANWPAILALVMGTAVGAFSGGLVPGTPGFGSTYFGFPALQAWLTGAVVYVVGVAVCYRRSNATHILGFPGIGEPSPVTAEDDASSRSEGAIAAEPEPDSGASS